MINQHELAEVIVNKWNKKTPVTVHHVQEILKCLLTELSGYYDQDILILMDRTRKQREMQ